MIHASIKRVPVCARCLDLLAKFQGPVQHDEIIGTAQLDIEGECNIYTPYDC